MAETTGFPSYALNTTGLRKTTSSARASVSASASSASIAALNAWLFMGARSLPMPVHRPGAQNVGAERTAEEILHLARGLDQLRQVNPRVDAHLVEHRDQVLG